MGHRTVSVCLLAIFLCGAFLEVSSQNPYGDYDDDISISGDVDSDPSSAETLDPYSRVTVPDNDFDYNEAKKTCGTSQYGCCADGVTYARGPNKDGCPETNLVGGCAGTRHGCCADRVTAAHGPNREGCPEIPQPGSHCSSTPYGCCADQQTAAQGPNRAGCPEIPRPGSHCSSTQYGCCADQETAARGPNRAGCPEIPEPTKKPTIILGGCRGTRYGCCSDGVTSAGDDNKSDCPENAVVSTASCGLKRDGGRLCGEWLNKWYYDADKGYCRQFWYGGCEGNANRFETQEDCKKSCANVKETVVLKPTCLKRCANGGVVDSLCRCRCPSGFIGPLCENAVQPPACLIVCANGGEVDVQSCRCRCPSGYTGEYCEEAPVVVQPPACNIRCANGGQVDLQSCRCRCPSGFTGDYCEEAVQPVCRIACQNGGQVDAQSCRCRCPSGFTGSSCENADIVVAPTRPCSSNPCQNGFSCQDYRNSTYSCDCNPDWGTNCERPPNYWCFNDNECAGDMKCVHEQTCGPTDFCETYSKCAASSKRFRCDDSRLCPSHEDCVNAARIEGGYFCQKKISYRRDTATSISCALSQHGCCPDRRSAAEGPDYEGCDIDGSGDGPCEDTVFGCCSDGVTAALGANLRGCEDTTDSEDRRVEEGTVVEIPEGGMSDKCKIPMRKLCQKKWVVKWHFDENKQKCTRNWWGGCKDALVFDSEADCEVSCLNNVVITDEGVEDPVKITGESHVDEGYEIKVTCQTLADKEEDITFYANGGVVIPTSVRYRINKYNSVKDNKVLTVSELVIPQASLRDAGPYLCRSRSGASDPLNIHVRPRQVRPETTTEATVQDVEYTISMDGTSQVEEGSNFTVTCHANGPQRPTLLEWFIQGTPVRDRASIETYNDPNTANGLISKLNIQNAGKEHMGTYYCRMRPAGKIARMVISFGRKARPEPRPRPRPQPQPRTTEAPLVNVKNSMVMNGTKEVMVGSDISIMCRAEGPSRPTRIEWFFNGKYYDKQDTLQNSVDATARTAIISKLTITNAIKDNSGTYYCRSYPGGKIANMRVSVRNSEEPRRTARPEPRPRPRPTARPVPRTTTKAPDSNVPNSSPCGLTRDAGRLCGKWVSKWYYDADIKYCRQFWYGGCEGNANRFESKEDCQKSCVNVKETETVAKTSAATPRPRTEAPSNVESSILMSGSSPVMEGSSFTLTCKAEGSRRPAQITWYFNSKVFNDSSAIETHKDPRALNRLISKLTIQNAQAEHKGVYYCRSSPYGDYDQINIEVKAKSEETSSNESSDPAVVCMMNMAVGNCYGAMPRWHYDAKAGKCKDFTWGGCGGNSNNFQSEVQCNRYCSPSVVCNQPKVTGVCRAYLERYYFDSSTRTCKNFTYGGCEANMNNFETIEACQMKCSSLMEGKKEEPKTAETNENVCQLPPEKGKCRGYKIMWYYRPASGQCSRFVYTGCEGNGNRFETEADCQASCRSSQPQTPRPRPRPTQAPVTQAPVTQAPRPTDSNVIPNVGDVCAQPKAAGSGNNYVIRWFYNSTRNFCERFWYNGRDGNDNRFESDEQCRSKCVTRRETPRPRPRPQPRPTPTTETRPQPQPRPDNKDDNVIMKPKGDHTMVYVNSGKDVILRCELGGQGVTWYREGYLLATSRRFDVLNNGSLLLRAVSNEMAGKYSCQTHSGLNNAPLLEKFHLQINEPLTILPGPPLMTVRPGDNAFFHCQASGNPTPGISWMREGQPIRNDRRRKVFTNGTLIISDVTDRDVGDYRCVADNGKDPRATRKIQLSLRETVEAAIGNHAGTFVEGGIIRLFCQGDGYPKPTVTWLKEGKELTSGGKILVNGGELVIRSAIINDAGLYKCMVSNGKSTDSAVTTVQIKLPTPAKECRDKMSPQKCKLVLAGRLCGFRTFSTKCCQSCRRAGLL